VRYLGSDTTHIFCMPTCRHARRVMERHEVEFRSEEEARSKGYRPCKICRPVAVAAA
jgi:methylphosphotriester-DNA--protein-cysteine methyltransferase